MDGRRILIFCETKKGCDAVTRQLRMDGWPSLSIHGDKSQHERDWVLAEFKAGKHPIMIATDVAARGLGRSCRIVQATGLAAASQAAGPAVGWWGQSVGRQLVGQMVCRQLMQCRRMRRGCLCNVWMSVGTAYQQGQQANTVARLRWVGAARGCCGSGGGHRGSGRALTRSAGLYRRLVPRCTCIHGSTLHRRLLWQAALLRLQRRDSCRGSAVAPAAWCAGRPASLYCAASPAACKLTAAQLHRCCCGKERR